MIITSTTDTLELVTSAAADIDVLACYIDADSTNGDTVGIGNDPTPITTATTTTIVAAPGSGKARKVTHLTVRNKDSSDPTDVTVQLDVSTTNYELHKVTLAPGETLEYIEGVGFFTLGSEALFDETRRVTADSTHPTQASFTGITGLSFAVLSGRNYIFDAALLHIANATTNGSNFGIGGVAMTYVIGGAISTVTNSVTAAAMSTGVITAVDTGVVVQTTGAAANAPTRFWGQFTPSASGTFQIRATPEVSNAAGLIVKQGSWARVCETTN
jgi:hypothetical protein